MKKLILIFLTLAFSFSLFACGDKGGDGKTVKLKINEVTHSIFYAPFYVAVEAGFFAEENIETEIVNGGGSDASMTAILSGAADIALLGPETGIYTLLGSPKDPPVIFAQLTKRDGSFLIGREKAEDFKWTDLIGKEIIAGRKGGSPAMSLEYALNINGLYNGKNVTLNFDVQFNMTTAAFEGGTGDFVTAFETTASELVRAGKGHIIASVGAESGDELKIMRVLDGERGLLLQ
ncbi:MAG: ABC transporter substrate-binding protein [Clostridia bacterium]|nr:ABC transporter substrate-binding protein [Clostridia bacterium]